jgi:hypothetical protein
MCPSTAEAGCATANVRCGRWYPSSSGPGHSERSPRGVAAVCTTMARVPACGGRYGLSNDTMGRNVGRRWSLDPPLSPVRPCRCAPPGAETGCEDHRSAYGFRTAPGEASPHAVGVARAGQCPGSCSGHVPRCLRSCEKCHRHAPRDSPANRRACAKFGSSAGSKSPAIKAWLDLCVIARSPLER